MIPERTGAMRVGTGARTIDWDGVLTFALTIGVLLLTAGTAYLLSLRQVVRIARMSAGAPQGGGWVLVPGKRLADGYPDADFRARLGAAARLAAGSPGRAILILGGTTGDSPVSEAAAGERFLRSLPQGDGLSIRLESASRDTLTNLRNARDLLGLAPKGTEAILISNRYHLARIGLIAGSLGIPHRLWPAEAAFEPDGSMGRRLLAEGFYCLWFRVGRGWARLTRNGRMLGRVT